MFWCFYIHCIEPNGILSQNATQHTLLIEFQPNNLPICSFMALDSFSFSVNKIWDYEIDETDHYGVSNLTDIGIT